MTHTYSNPRKHAIIPDWPSGQHRVEAEFGIEYKVGKGERAWRTTKHPKTGKPSAPKVLTYARKQRIVDGDDGKTYIVAQTGYNMILVMQSNMQYQEEVVHDDNPRYEAMMALFADPVA